MALRVFVPTSTENQGRHGTQQLGTKSLHEGEMIGNCLKLYFQLTVRRVVLAGPISQLGLADQDRIRKQPRRSDSSIPSFFKTEDRHSRIWQFMEVGIVAVLGGTATWAHVIPFVVLVSGPRFQQRSFLVRFGPELFPDLHQHRHHLAGLPRSLGAQHHAGEPPPMHHRGAVDSGLCRALVCQSNSESLLAEIWPLFGNRLPAGLESSFPR